MAEKLTDPSKPAHEIIEVLEDGDAIRNDGVRLTAANKNPWYVLATIFGEYTETPRNLSIGSSFHCDNKLQELNRRAWNGWFRQNLTDQDVSKIVKGFELDEKDVARLSSDELDDIRGRFLQRTDNGIELPKRHFVPCDEEEPEIGEYWRAEYFNNLIFTKPIYFNGFLFDDMVSFSNSSFLDEACFSKTIFFAGASFENTHFSHGADFSNSNFVPDSMLRSENAPAIFNRVSFSNDVFFNHAQFSDKVEFRSAKFFRKASFRAAAFKDYAAFRSAMFSDHALFRETQFGGFANFASANFQSITRFNDAKFQKQVPEFYGASLFENVIFPFPPDYTKNWPRLSGSGIMPVEQQKRAYNRLRLFMNKSLQIDEEQFFHRQEMRCKTVLASWYHKPFYWLYALLSDFGNSVWRPLFWMVFVMLSGALFMLWWQEAFTFLPKESSGFDWTLGLLGEDDPWAKPRQAAGWSISNTLPFLGFGKLYYGELAKDLAWPLKVAGGVQTLLGYVLLFFFGLGLRNRFRLR